MQLRKRIEALGRQSPCPGQHFFREDEGAVVRDNQLATELGLNRSQHRCVTKDTNAAVEYDTAYSGRHTRGIGLNASDVLLPDKGRVAHDSYMPYPGGLNPTLKIQANALRIARLVAQEVASQASATLAPQPALR